MKLELQVERGIDGLYTALLSGRHDDGREISARSPGNETAVQAAQRVLQLFSTSSPRFWTGVDAASPFLSDTAWTSQASGRSSAPQSQGSAPG